jgi:hypothetical protein
MHAQMNESSRIGHSATLAVALPKRKSILPMRR